MARVKVTKYTDDLDGVSEANETVQFSLDGEDFEIHLTTEHATEFRATVTEFTGSARKAGAPRKKPSNGTKGHTPAVDRAENARIRAWAAKQGFVLPPRGRIRIDVRNAFFDAHM